MLKPVLVHRPKKNRTQAGFGLLGQSLLTPAQDSETIIEYTETNQTIYLAIFPLMCLKNI